MSAYYNEIDPYAAAWLRNLIAEGLIPDGIVDERSITDVQPADLAGFTQCHFFAGLGGWGAALRLAGWPDDRPIWTGSCPCQPFSVAGKGAGTADVRHLWPDFFRLIRACRPPLVLGEQVAGSAGYGWLDGVVSDLEAEGYASRGVDIPACAVDAPHIRSRLYWITTRGLVDAQGVANDGQIQPGERKNLSGPVDASGRLGAAERGDVACPVADAGRERGVGWPGERGPSAEGASVGREGVDHDQRRGGTHGDVADSDLVGQPHERVDGLRWTAVHDVDGRGERVDVGDTLGAGLEGRAGHGDDRDQPGRQGAEPVDPAGLRRRPANARRANGTDWSDHVWLVGADGKARRAQPGICLLAHGIPARVGKLRAFGNAIVPQVAAEVVGAYLDTEHEAGIDTLL